MIIKNLIALGLYGGASLNSIELALINTDGIDVKEFIKTSIIPYPEYLSNEIRSVLGKRVLNFEYLEKNSEVQKIREMISEFYVDTIKEFTDIDNVDVIGIDSLTICNDPQNKCSYQIENGQIICSGLNKNIITHFHKADLLSGGQASPLSPAFLNALALGSEKPILFIDLEAVSSLIYIGESGELMAFDCSPGLALIEDWTFRHANMQTDYNGKLAITGNIDEQIVNLLLNAKILKKQPPKSLDILDFSDKKEHLEGLSLEDGAATASYFIANAIYQSACKFIPDIPDNIYVCGEGLKNPSLMRFLKHCFSPYELKNISDINDELSTIGAQSTAFNAVRRYYSLPITFPTTTGAYEPMTGGEFYEKK